MATRRTPRPLMDIGITPQPPPRRRDLMEEALALCRDPSTPVCDQPNCRRKFHFTHRTCPYCHVYGIFNRDRRPPPPKDVLDEAQRTVALEQLLEPPTQAESQGRAGEETPPPPPPPPDQNFTSYITEDGHL